MKAGIYKRRDNGRHIYVAKDRSIRAHQLTDCHPLAAGLRKVNCQQKEQVVTFDEGDEGRFTAIYADRVADAPNGVTEHYRALQEYVRWLPADAVQDIVTCAGALPVSDYPADIYTKEPAERTVGVPRTLGIGYGPDALLASAQTIRETNAGVPPHIAKKAVEDFRAGPIGQAYRTAVTDDKGDVIGVLNLIDTPEPPVLERLPPNETPINVISEKKFISKDDLIEQGVNPDMVAAKMYAGVSTVNAFAREDRMTQVMLEAERRGFVRHIIHDEFAIIDVDAFNNFCDNLPAVLPIVPKGWYVQHARPDLVALSSTRVVLYPHTGSEDFILDPERRFHVVKDAPPCQPFTPSKLPTWSGCPASVEIDLARARVRAGTLRLIGKQSKRKHRKAGHRVFWCAPLQSWAWEPRA